MALSISGNSIQVLQRTFSTPITWTKASASTRYRFEVVGVGEFHPDFHVTAHAHAYYELGLGLQGCGELILGKERILINPGCLFIVEPDLPHRLSAATDDCFFVFLFRVFSEPVRKDFSPVPLPGIYGSCIMDNRDLLNLILSWAEVNQKRIVDPFSLSLFTRYLAYEMVSFLSRGNLVEAWTLVERAKGYIEETLPGKIEVGAMADHLGVSERTLRRHFQLDLENSVMEYVNKRRLALAQRYLALHLSVADIARLVGFESSSQLSRLFQKSMGITPKAWQQALAPTRRIPRSVQ